eukprot:271293-Chlamydomonas_euryale.AAC.1
MSCVWAAFSPTSNPSHFQSLTLLTPLPSFTHPPQDPAQRVNARDAFSDEWFWHCDPPPCDPKNLPCHGSSHEFTMKKRRNEEKDRVHHGAGGVPPGAVPVVATGGAALGGGGGRGPPQAMGAGGRPGQPA